MKKIVAGIVALAMAASVFAVDVASMLQIDGSLMSYDKTNGFQAIMAKEWDPQGSSDYIWKLSTSGDKSGAEIWAWSDTGDKKVKTDGWTIQQYSIWMKPADWLKITIGNVYDCSIFNPQFGWWAKNMEATGYGYMFDFSFDALSMTLSFMPGQGAYWFSNKTIGSFYMDVVYNFDGIGSVQGYFGKGIADGVHGVDSWQNGAYVIGAVWGNQPYMQNGYFVDANVGFDSNWKFADVTAQIGGQYFTNGFGVQMTNEIVYRNDFRYGFELKAQYAMDGWTPYIQIDGYNVMGDTDWGTMKWTGAKKLTVDVGATTSVGGCSITAYADFPIAFSGYSFNFSVPVEFTVNL